MDVELARPPAWSIAMLRDAMERNGSVSTASVDRDEPPVRLYGERLERWYGRVTSLRPDGSLDRSQSLWWIARGLADGGATVGTIIQAIRERDETLGWAKYIGRNDEDARYNILATRALDGSPFSHFTTPKEKTKSHTSDDEFEAADLINEKLAEPRWAVPGIFPEGVVLLAGKSKLGKSWLAMDVALAVAEGSMAWGAVAVERGDVYYLALEDSKRRLQDRLRTLRRGTAPRGLTFRVKSPRANEGGIDTILDWLNRHPAARLVIIDVLGKFRPKEANARRLYDLDYEAIAPIADVARTRGICVLVICHCNKMNPEDPLDSVSGTTGLVGAADAICVLRRERGKADASLFVTGRDVEEQDLAFKNTLEQPGRCSAWQLLPGDASQFRMSEQRQEVIEALRAVPGMTPSEIAGALGKPAGTIRNLLFHMTRDEDVRLREGRYYPTNANAANGNSPIGPISFISPVSAVSENGKIRCKKCGGELQPGLERIGLHHDCVLP